ncbi:MAG: RadC family protein [Clostridia bacterium]|nr:RadC family protein [Clostridia bacterium]
MTNNPHKDHRNRLKNRFIKEGLMSFDPHQILELLLFYAIPRRDVNPLAHRLLDTFGSLSAVFDATYEDLLRVPGVGENTATLLRMMVPVCRAYLIDRDTRYPHFGDAHQLGSYLVNYFVGETREKLVAAFLNNRAGLISLDVISEGVVNKTDVPLRLITNAALRKEAAAVVLAHNHPDGIPEPSDADVAITHEIATVLGKLGIPLRSTSSLPETDTWASATTSTQAAPLALKA